MLAPYFIDLLFSTELLSPRIFLFSQHTSLTVESTFRYFRPSYLLLYSCISFHYLIINYYLFPVGFYHYYFTLMNVFCVSCNSF